MAIYWLTFRLADKVVGGRSYETRRKALYNAINKLCPQWWIEPTSFIAFESSTAIRNIAVAAKAAIAPTTDVVLIREMDTKSAVLVGTAEHPESIKELMPYLKTM